MLEKIFKKGYLNIENLILDNTKKLGITGNEAFVLIHLLKEFNKSGNISPDSILDKVLMPINEIDKIMTTLMERAFYEIFITYDNGIGKETVSFKPLFLKLENIILEKETVDEYDIQKVNQYLCEKMNRVLTASELEVLQGLIIDDRYTYEQIVSATEVILSKKRVLSMRTLTQALANNKVEAKPKKEAPKALKDYFSQL